VAETAKASPKPIHEAFIEAYAEMPDPKKNAENPAFKRDNKPIKYADLEAFLDVAKPILAACGFALIQAPVNDGPLVGVHTWLLYVTGEKMDFGQFVVALSKPDPQGAGAALTYCRRYAVAAIFGLAQEDDDANRASGGADTPASTPAATPRTGLASDNQIGLIFGLAHEVGWDDDYLNSTIAKSKPGKNHPGDLTKAEASAFIDVLKARKAQVDAKIAEVEADLAAEAPAEDYTLDPDAEEIQF